MKKRSLFQDSSYSVTNYEQTSIIFWNINSYSSKKIDTILT